MAFSHSSQRMCDINWNTKGNPWSAFVLPLMQLSKNSGRHLVNVSVCGRLGVCRTDLLYAAPATGLTILNTLKLLQANALILNVL